MRPSPDLPASGHLSPFRVAASRLQGAASVLSARRCGAPVAASPAGPARAQASGSPGRSLPAVHTTGAAVATSPYLAGSRLLEISISVNVVSLASPGGCELCADGDSDSAGVAVTACTVRTQRGHGKAPGGASQTSQSPSSQLGNSSAAVDHGSRGRMVVCQIPVAGFAVYSFVRVRRMGVQCPVGVAEEQSCPGEGPFGKGGAHNPGGSRASGWRRLVNLGIFVPREGCLPATTTPLKGTALASDWCTNNKVRGLRPRSGRSPALGSARAPRGRTGLRFEALPAGGDGVHAGARGTAAKPWLG